MKTQNKYLNNKRLKILKLAKLIIAEERLNSHTFETIALKHTLNINEIMKEINDIRDFDLVFDLSAGVPGNAEWVQFACDEYNVPLFSGCTSIMKADTRPYVDSGQIKRMLSGHFDTIDYKNLIEKYLKNR